MSVATCTDHSYNVQIQSYLFSVFFFSIHVTLSESAGHDVSYDVHLHYKQDQQCFEVPR